MVRNYKRKVGSRSYRNYTEDALQNAIRAVQSKRLSVKKAAETYKIPRKSLENKVNKKHLNKPGRPTVFSKAEEDLFCAALVTVQKLGFPFDLMDFRCMVKSYLDKSGRKCQVFKENYPGLDFCQSFSQRNKTLSNRNANNMKRARATVTPDEMEQYFDNLAETTDGVPPQNIFNYDESNLSDDPGRKKVIAKRGSKYVDRIMNTSKSSHSVTMSGSAHGDLLPVYTVYKSAELWDTWCEGGPKGKPFCEDRCCAGGARFNQSKSGWFEARTFSDWFFTTFLPHAKRLAGKTVLIGDNLSSHFTSKILKSCEENNIAFVCLPPNSAHICQPLDVSFFAPMKRSWRKILSDWKAKNRRSSAVPKSEFPGLLVLLSNTMAENARENLKSGFKTCGIHPMNKDEVLSKMPNNQSHDDAADILSTSVTEMLQEMRYDKQKKAPKKRKLLAVEPGKSISTSDIATTDTGEESSAPKKTKKKAKCLKKTKPGRLNKEQEGCDVNNNTTHGSDSSNDPIPQVSQVSASPSGQLEVNAPTFPSQTCRGSSDPETLPGTSKMSDTQQVSGIDNDTTGATASTLLREVKNLNDLGQNTLVAAVYGNKWWIGKVLDVSDENNDVEIFFMMPSGPSQKFHWGGSDEKCWVPVKHILGIVPSLQLLPFGKISTRFFQIPEELVDEIEAKFLKHLMV